MIVCVCNNISEREIQQAVSLGVDSMAALRDDLGVSTCCGVCWDCAKEVLADALENQPARCLIQPLKAFENSRSLA